MKASVSIPQHKLTDASGRPVEFDFAEWTGDHIYNTEKAHRHEFYEILFFEEGTAIHDIDFTTYPAAAGSVHFVASDNVHLLARQDASTGFSLLFTANYLTTDVMNLLPFSHARPVLQLAPEERKRVQVMTGEIKREYEDRASGYERLIRVQMQALALYLGRIYAMRFPADTASQTPAHITRFQELVKKHFSEHLTVEAYAHMLHISPKHLIDLCRRHTGKTPMQYIREHMITEAKRLLYNTDLTIKEVAYRLNFEDPAGFSRYFKSFCGYTPASYRKDAGK